MKLDIREMHSYDIEIIVDYFVNADHSFLRGMGVEKNKLPKRADWIEKLKIDLTKPYEKKEFYYVIWLIDNKAVGHSNINMIEFDSIATMHLHLWDKENRKNGLGIEFLKLTIPCYFEKFSLKKLICEPFSENVGPNKALKKVGFSLVKIYDTIPGWINFYQVVNRYELKKEQLPL